MAASGGGGPIFPGGGGTSGSADLTPEYAQSLGRIGGQLLAANLEFQGQDIQFDTDLLYLDVVNNRIGINNYGTSPEALYLGSVSGSDQTIDTVNLIVDGTTITNSVWTISSNTIQLASGTLYVTPDQSSNPTIITNGVGSANVNITDRLLATKNINESLYLTPDNVGIVQVNGNMQVTGVNSLTYVTGNVLVDGNYVAGSVINLGDANADTIAFTADQNSDLIPKITNNYNLGSLSKKWNDVYAQQLRGTTVTTTSATAGGITLSGNSIYSTNIANDITIFTPTNVLFSIADGEESLSPVVDIIDGGGSFDALLGIIDGGPAEILYNSNIGNVLFNGLAPFTGSNINNNTVGIYNAPYYLLSTADGYFNFAGTNGVVFPVGTTAERNTEVLGTTRYNTDSGFLEIYNGSNWQNSNGNIALATIEDINDSSVIYDLILG